MAVSIYVLRRRHKGVPRVSESYHSPHETPEGGDRSAADEAGEQEIDRRFQMVHDRARRRNHQIGSTYREMERLRMGAKHDEV